jgi:hypothetical protein
MDNLKLIKPQKLPDLPLELNEKSLYLYFYKLIKLMASLATHFIPFDLLVLALLLIYRARN